MLELAGADVVVWGLGRHGGGLAAARLCAAAGARVVILDAQPAERCGDDGATALAEGFTCLVGDAAHPAFSSADLIVPSPAIPPRAWPAAHPPVASPEALALAQHRGQRVAVTGTKGKSTTAMIAGAVLGWRVAGNSWRPLAEAVLADPEAPLVCELSSFQLWYLFAGASPSTHRHATGPLGDHRPTFDAAILTLLASDHLDWHPDLAHYRAAKLALLGWSRCVAAAPQTLSLLPAGLSLLPAAPEPLAADLAVPGPHNRANAALAIAVARRFGVDDATIRERLRGVRPLPHRLDTVHRAGGIAFVNDSIATTPEAAMAGLASFDGPLAIILGGSDKGADFTQLAAAVAQRGARPVLLGATATRIAGALAAIGIDAVIATDLDDAVRRAGTAVAGGGTVLLSPACASFDRFRGFDDRGRQFAAAAIRLFPTA